MIYSVYRPELRKYDYYERPQTPDDARNPTSDDIDRRHPRGGADGQDLGVSSERGGYRLPAGVQFIGRGDAPRGMVATRNPGGAPSSVGGIADVVAKVPFLGWLAVGLVGYQLLKRK